MNSRVFRAMNTEWWIGTPRDLDLSFAETMVHDAEQRWSRFRADSALSQLNRDRARLDPALAAIVRHALAMHEATEGAFDVRVGAALTAAGYDRTFEQLPQHAAIGSVAMLTFAPPAQALHVEVIGDEIRLDGPGTIDLGGIAKGWTVDRVAEALECAGCRDYLVDGGGDIRAAGCDEQGEPWFVGVGAGLGVRLRDAAVCTSSTRRRRWPAPGEASRVDQHHIIDPATGTPSRYTVVEAVVVASDATLADVLATTVIADPERGLRAVEAHGAAALVLRENRWEMTPKFQRWLA